MSWLKKIYRTSSNDFEVFGRRKSDIMPLESTVKKMEGRTITLYYLVSPPEAKPYVDKAWSIDGCSIGFTYVGTCSPGSCAYVAQYLMKTGTSDQRRKENGRQKEFAIMSRKPGIGSRAIDRFVGAYKTEVGSVALKVFKWPSERFRAGGRNYPIGRYLKGQLLTKLGFEKDDIESHNVGIRTINDMKVAVEGAKSYFNARVAAVEQQEGRIMVWKTKRRKV